MTQETKKEPEPHLKLVERSTTDLSEVMGLDCTEAHYAPITLVKPDASPGGPEE